MNFQRNDLIAKRLHCFWLIEKVANFTCTKCRSPR
ncbi:Uncharacterized protein BM_BM14493 [Brugia malayi]|uniref:Bm14493 n=1 Tax=Brugia malayi TaxID=6279 RepID=A0A0J9Y5L5_BRUMA|nr:Uncharacterized protein BM_BM14493 [Brugia malayi]CDQ02321.2 Bm14493 [Brugia malayi]VIO96373.1 Uncharacterized protein BM_BM14493 [Brugia malayi]